MQVDVVKYKISISGGYLAEAKDGVKDIYLEHPDQQLGAGHYMFGYYKPKEFTGDEAEWKEFAKNEENKEYIANTFKRWDSFVIEIYEQDLARYAKLLDSVSIVETKIIPVHLTGTMEHKQLEAVQRLTDMTIEKLQKAGELIEQYSQKLGMDVFGGEDTFNFKCGQYQPGNILSMFNETMLAEDSCTNALQDYLNDGWRIIAVSPQPDSRRPDYILGRYNVNYDKNHLPNGAQRGR